jgi:hypothetical protein
MKQGEVEEKRPKVSDVHSIEGMPDTHEYR